MLSYIKRGKKKIGFCYTLRTPGPVVAEPKPHLSSPRFAGSRSPILLPPKEFSEGPLRV